MIEKMNFVSITGPKHDIDRVIDTYLSKYEIHLENALDELKEISDLTPYVEDNPYKEYVTLSKELVGYTDGVEPENLENINVDEAIAFIDKVKPKIHALQSDILKITKEKEYLQDSYNKIAPFKSLKYDIEDILSFKFIKFRFGRIPKEFWYNFKHYADNDLYTIFEECAIDNDFVWGIYFVPELKRDRIDAVYSSLHFERTFIPDEYDEYDGTPVMACNKLLIEIDKVDTKLRDLETTLQNNLNMYKAMLFSSFLKIQSASDNFDVRKTAACTNNDGHIFYIICGWMTSSDSIEINKETTGDPNVVVLLEEPIASTASKPPTKLKNPKIFKPFEMFITMYGLPTYGEFDPTIFVALTYSFIFGMMFGDVGQGLCLFIGGALLYKIKKIPLAAIISSAGIFSTIFGFMFGSIFGFEDVLDAVWLRPTHHMTSLPFLGSMNTIFVLTIAFGMFLILIAMIINIINGLKSHNLGKALFDTNGIAGFIFYSALVAIIMLFMTGRSLPGTAILIIMFVIPLIIIGFKEPLTRLVEKKSTLMPKEKGMFFIQMFFELFEMLLSYLSNTLSFIRIGAFAVSHAIMMEVVLMLAGIESGAPNIAVIIIGNIVVTGLEGLIVGIQVLRLEYYEMFSRFYDGNGKEFKPYKKQLPIAPQLKNK